MSDKKKKKTKYIDDGSTVADMSNVGGGLKGKSDTPRPKSTARDKWNTYFATVKQMFLPMLIVLGIITIAFGVIYLLL